MPNHFQKQVNEFLKRRGLQPTQGDKFPFFDIRKTLFGQLGQTDKFIGSENQNALIDQGLQKAEKNVGVKITPDNIFDVVGAGRPQSFEEVMASSRALQERIKTEGITGAGGEQLLAPTADRTLEVLTAPEGGAFLPPLPQIQPTSIPTSTPEPTPEPTGTAVTGTTPTDLAPVSAAGLLPEIPTGQQLATQALETVTGAATFPLTLEAQTAQKEAVQLGAQRETESFIRNIASRGLIFSGAKKTGVSQIEADKLADLLNIDRKFALLMVQGLETAAQGIAKEAQKGRQEAIDALESLGFAIAPDGTIQPTLAARTAISREQRAVRTEERLTDVEARQQQQFQLSVAKAEEQARQFGITQERLTGQFEARRQLDVAKFDLSIAKTQQQIAEANERLRISQANLEIAQNREARLAQQALDTNTYTPTQLGKLRAFDIDIADTEAADTLLFKSEKELKKLLLNREKEGQAGFLERVTQLPDVFFDAWNNTKSFFGF